MVWIAAAHFFVALTVFLTLLASVWKREQRLADGTEPVWANDSRVNLEVLTCVALLGMLSVLFLHTQGYAASAMLTGVATLGLGRFVLRYFANKKIIR